MPWDVLDPLALDPLTGLPRRDALRQAGGRLCHGSKTGPALRAAGMDLDHFNELNDRHLLPGGDKVLVAMARLLSSLACPSQWLYRDGGDQFTFLLPGTDRAEAYREAERFRGALAAALVGGSSPRWRGGGGGHGERRYCNPNAGGYRGMEPIPSCAGGGPSSEGCRTEPSGVADPPARAAEPGRCTGPGGRDGSPPTDGNALSARRRCGIMSQ